MQEPLGADTPFDPLHDSSLLDQDESGHDLNPEATGQVRALVDINLQHS